MKRAIKNKCRTSLGKAFKMRVEVGKKYKKGRIVENLFPRKRQKCSNLRVILLVVSCK